MCDSTISLKCNLTIKSLSYALDFYQLEEERQTKRVEMNYSTICFAIEKKTFKTHSLVIRNCVRKFLNWIIFFKTLQRCRNFPRLKAEKRKGNPRTRSEPMLRSSSQCLSGVDTYLLLLMNTAIWLMVQHYSVDKLSGKQSVRTIRAANQITNRRVINFRFNPESLN